MNYELFMAEAIAEARRGAEAGEAPIGSVAVIDDAMIARDHDHSTMSEDPTAHAVLLTLQAAARKLGPRRLAEATIFTTDEPGAMCVARSWSRASAPSCSRCPTPSGARPAACSSSPRDPKLPHQLSVVLGRARVRCEALGVGVRIRSSCGPGARGPATLLSLGTERCPSG